MKRSFLFHFLLAGCASVSHVAPPTQLEVSVARAALEDVMAKGYVLSTDVNEAIAVCFPNMTDPPKGFLSSIGRPNLFPCSALKSATASAPRIIRASRRRATQCSIDSLKIEADGESAMVEGSCVDQPLSGGGFVVTLKRQESGWIVTANHPTWTSMSTNVSGHALASNNSFKPNPLRGSA
jgi:hypothetical protein